MDPELIEILFLEFCNFVNKSDKITYKNTDSLKDDFIKCLLNYQNNIFIKYN